MRRLIVFSLCLLALAPDGGAVSQNPTPKWDEFWRSVKVEPPPPRDFLDGPQQLEILNRTEGHLDDATAQRWVLADLRRARGDRYATFELREDIANADVFGPPGLNGTSEVIRTRRAHGVVRLTREGVPVTVRAVVLWISPKERAKYAQAQLTEYIIVLAKRSTGRVGKLIFQDGHSEELPGVAAAGEMRYQLDTGHFVQHPVLGPLWYQQMGWSCTPGDGTVTGEICARAKS